MRNSEKSSLFGKAAVVFFTFSPGRGRKKRTGDTQLLQPVTAWREPPHVCNWHQKSRKARVFYGVCRFSFFSFFFQPARRGGGEGEGEMACFRTNRRRFFFSSGRVVAKNVSGDTGVRYAALPTGFLASSSLRGREIAGSGNNSIPIILLRTMLQPLFFSQVSCSSSSYPHAPLTPPCLVFSRARLRGRSDEMRYCANLLRIYASRYCAGDGSAVSVVAREEEEEEVSGT